MEVGTRCWNKKLSIFSPKLPKVASPVNAQKVMLFKSVQKGTKYLYNTKATKFAKSGHVSSIKLTTVICVIKLFLEEFWKN